MRRGSLVAIIVAACAILAAPTAQAQPDTSARDGWDVDLSGGLAAAFAVPDGDLPSAYTPVLDFFPSTGAAGQTLALATGAGPGFWLALDLWPARHAGLEVTVDWTRVGLSGANGPYRVHLEYISRPPPDYAPHLVVYDRATPWPDTAGDLTTMAVGVNAATRWQAGRVSGTASGGLAATRVSGHADGLGYTTFRLGGHSVLFPDEYRVRIDLGPAWMVGVNFRGTVAFDLTSRLALVAGGHYIRTGTADLGARVSAILNEDDVLVTRTVDEIQDALSPGPARLAAGGVRFLVGLRASLARADRSSARSSSR